MPKKKKKNPGGSGGGGGGRYVAIGDVVEHVCRDPLSAALIRGTGKMTSGKAVPRPVLEWLAQHEDAQSAESQWDGCTGAALMESIGGAVKEVKATVEQALPLTAKEPQRAQELLEAAARSLDDSLGTRHAMWRPHSSCFQTEGFCDLYVLIHCNLALCCADRGDGAAALAHAQLALEGNPGDCDALHQKARAHILLKQAREALHAAREAGPSNDDAYHKMAWDAKAMLADQMIRAGVAKRGRVGQPVGKDLRKERTATSDMLDGVKTFWVDDNEAREMYDAMCVLAAVAPMLDAEARECILSVEVADLAAWLGEENQAFCAHGIIRCLRAMQLDARLSLRHEPRHQSAATLVLDGAVPRGEITAAGDGTLASHEARPLEDVIDFATQRLAEDYYATDAFDRDTESGAALAKVAARRDVCANTPEDPEEMATALQFMNEAFYSKMLKLLLSVPFVSDAVAEFHSLADACDRAARLVAAGEQLRRLQSSLTARSGPVVSVKAGVVLHPREDVPEGLAGRVVAAPARAGETAEVLFEVPIKRGAAAAPAVYDGCDARGRVLHLRTDQITVHGDADALCEGCAAVRPYSALRASCPHCGYVPPAGGPADAAGRQPEVGDAAVPQGPAAAAAGAPAAQPASGMGPEKKKKKEAIQSPDMQASSSPSQRVKETVLKEKLRKAKAEVAEAMRAEKQAREAMEAAQQAQADEKEAARAKKEMQAKADKEAARAKKQARKAEEMRAAEEAARQRKAEEAARRAVEDEAARKAEKARVQEERRRRVEEEQARAAELKRQRQAAEADRQQKAADEKRRKAEAKQREERRMWKVTTKAKPSAPPSSSADAVSRATPAPSPCSLPAERGLDNSRPDTPEAHIESGGAGTAAPAAALQRVVPHAAPAAGGRAVPDAAAGFNFAPADTAQWDPQGKEVNPFAAAAPPPQVHSPPQPSSAAVLDASAAPAHDAAHSQHRSAATEALGAPPSAALLERATGLEWGMHLVASLMEDCSALCRDVQAARAAGNPHLRLVPVPSVSW